MRIVMMLFASICFVSVAEAQTAVKTAEGDWVSPSTGRAFNNPMSAVIDGQLLQMRQNQLVFGQMMTGLIIDNEWRRIGRGVIESGNATTALAPLDEAMAERVAKLTSARETTEADIAKLAEQLAPDLIATRRLATRRGVDADDSAELYAMVLLVGFEQYTGNKTTPAQQAGLARDLRAMLLKDELFQGQGVIGAEMQIAKFAVAIAQVQRIAEAGDAEAAKAAGGALLQSLWRDPVASIESTEDGLIDRGRRIVRDGKGTTTFERTRSDESIARERVRAVHLGGVFAPNDEAAKQVVEEQQAQWIAQHVADVATIRSQILAVGMPVDDLAACGVAAIELLWPLVDENKQTLNDVQRAATRSMLEEDIRSDAGFQRMDDAERQLLFDRWSSDAVVAARELSALRRAEDLEAKAKTATDAMDGLMLQSQASAARMEATAGHAKAISLLTQLFAPRKLEDIELEAEGFVVRP